MANAVNIAITLGFTLLYIFLIIFMIVSFAQRKWLFPEYEPTSIGEGSFQPWGEVQSLTPEEVEARQAVISSDEVCEN